MLISRRIHSQRYWVDMDICGTPWGFSGDLVGKKKQNNKKPNLPTNAGDVRDTIQFLGLEDPLKEGMATHFSILD